MRIFIFFLFVLGLSCCRVNDNADHLNILFLMVDDLGKEWVSCYGAEDIVTPNVDRLAKEGMLFRSAYSMPQCTPTRVTLLTGEYPFRHGWVNHWDVPRWGGGAHFDENLNPSLGLLMKNAGYITAAAGKWQINDFRVEPDAMEKHGFDEYCMWTGYEAGVRASGKRYWDPYIHTSSGSRTYEGEFGPDIFGDFIINFIRQHSDTTWFVYYPMALTHPPLTNTPDESAGDKIGKHKAMVRYTDKITGKIMQVLDETGQRDHTIFIWTTDNGTSHGLSGHLNGYLVPGGKAKTTENGICEPFIVSCPGLIESGKVSDALIDFTDLLPTFVDLAGSELPSGVDFDGYSFKDVLNGHLPDGARTWILGMGGGNNARLTVNGVENQYGFRDRVLRNKRYKLFISTKNQPEKFFDLMTDPREEHNLIDSLQPGDQQENFNQLLDVSKQFPKRDNDPIYKPLPKQSWDVKIKKSAKKN